MSEAEFLASYDPQAYPPVAVTVDVVALTIRDAQLHVLLVRRGAAPYEGAWALPGGFVQPDEDLPTAAARELAEETGLDARTGPGTRDTPGRALRRVHLEQLASYGGPDRDPRMRVVSVAYLAFAPELPDPAAGSDAAAAAWVPVAALGLPEAVTPDRPVRQRPGTSRRLAFDHATILADGLDRARAKLEYTPLATRFVGEEFTISELRGVYETVWGVELHAGNFHRKVLSVPGFLDSVGATTERGGPRGGPRARIYRAGDARLLHPALLRPAREEAIR
ncbi:NUDIX domain-containing protein [Solwaraspora sp. WMMD406]|uniref:NUDIX domain-containing protein n=1 Tax=Solwaraspora sp. WMMD406 TaxID=3016095 RepID=UPI00241704D6|nr:NUDIX domain-containing protein [Solwaraspora sp. WMMD406]MDG4766013.1 NUDIX domain-containing protein [Solwaraspora sp. WMMD406]